VTSARLKLARRWQVVVHTLVGAAHFLIADLSSAANQETLLQKYIGPEKLGEFEKAIRAPQNS
jgi:hypothetical protein